MSLLDVELGPVVVFITQWFCESLMLFHIHHLSPGLCFQVYGILLHSGPESQCHLTLILENLLRVTDPVIRNSSAGAVRYVTGWRGQRKN